jgi:hypothetical protein
MLPVMLISWFAPPKAARGTHDTRVPLAATRLRALEGDVVVARGDARRLASLEVGGVRGDV